jgi:hypothetical protein
MVHGWLAPLRDLHVRRSQLQGCVAELPIGVFPAPSICEQTAPFAALHGKRSQRDVPSGRSLLAERHHVRPRCHRRLGPRAADESQTDQAQKTAFQHALGVTRVR